MKLKLIAFIAAAAMCIPAASHAGGWGEEQSKGTLRGGLWGAVLGGVVGHQSGKRDEGLLIGTVLGGIIGNKSGKGKDERQVHDSRYNRYNQSRDLLYRRPGTSSYSSRVPTRSTDPEVLAAEQRAEAIEREVQRERALILAAQEKERKLVEAREREERALAELRALRGK